MRRKDLLVVTLISALVSATMCWADRSPPRPERDPDDQRAPRERRFGRGGEFRPGARRGLPPTDDGIGGLPIARLFPPRPEDRGPLRPGEREELQRFAQEHMPHMSRMLRRLERRDPEQFDRRLQEMVPHLRHLRRIFEHDAELGREVVTYVANQRDIHHLWRVLYGVRLGDGQRPHIRQELRQRLAENVRIETLLIEEHVSGLRRSRTQRVDELLERLIQEDADLAALPPEAREHVARFHEARDEEARAAALAVLRLGVTRRVEDEIELWSDRLEQLQTAPEEIVDQRLEHMLNTAPPGRPGGHEPGSGHPPHAP